MSASAVGRSPAPRASREDVVAALLATWAVLGLALDGRAHEGGGVESFFTVWHLILYTGLGAAAAWTLRGGRAALAGDRVRLVSLLGLGLLAAGGPADLAWHEAFGFEENLEALLSPSHLLLLAGALLLVTQPFRSAVAAAPAAGRSRAAAVASLVLATALVAFFVQYLTPFHDPEIYGGGGEELRVRGLAAILVTGVLVTLPLLLLAARLGPPPAGACVAVFGGVALMLLISSHDAPLELVAAAFAGGLAAEALSRGLRPRRERALALRGFAVGASLAFWGPMLAALALGPGLDWSPELWSGSMVLAAGVAFALALLVGPVPPDGVDGQASVAPPAA